MSTLLGPHKYSLADAFSLVLKEGSVSADAAAVTW